MSSGTIVRAGILLCGFAALSAFAEAPLRAALYMDDGCRGGGATVWARILGYSPDVELKTVSGADIRAGALDDRELLVMPGGAGGPQYRALGDAGAEKIRAFVANGGAYFGTCCGMSNALNEEQPFAKRLRMLPLKNIPPFGRGGFTASVKINARGAEWLGVREGEWKIRYHNGPVVEPADPVELCTECEVLATMNFEKEGDVPAAVRAKYGKGTMFVLNCHPEVGEESRQIVVAGIRALTGRTIRLALPETLALEGPFPLLVTPWTEEAKVDIPVLAKEADYVAAQGVGGLVWPSAGDAVAKDEGYEEGLTALAEQMIRAKRKTVVTAVCSGANSAAAIECVRTAERVARRTGARMAILARPPDDATNQTMIVDHYMSLARATTLPVIVQTFNGKSPQPAVTNLVRLMRSYPEVYGYVKEESPGLTVNGRMAEILAHKETKGVFSGWGGKGWVYQGSQIGTCGVISQRPAYASLFVKVWDRLKAGADASDPELADAYAKYLYMANLGDIFSKWGDDEMRGPHLYVLQKLGIFRNRLNRTGPGKVEEYKMSEAEMQEVEARMRHCGLLASEKKSVPKIILDSDMLSDFDDVGAAAMLHTFADRGECEILATVACTVDGVSPQVLELINAYYGRPDLPVGCCRKGVSVKGRGRGHDKFFKLVKDYPELIRTKDPKGFETAVRVYRKALASAEDKSVTICSLGFLTNMRDLLKSGPDDLSPLSGRELVAKKVSLWVAMACNYPNGKEYNSKMDPAASKTALEEWPTPIVFTDFQYGRTLYAGRKIAESDVKRSPVRDIFKDSMIPLEKVTADSWDQKAGHPSWDETAVLIAVRGLRYFNVERGTYKMVGEKGDDEWVADTASPHCRVTVKLPRARVGAIIDDLICAGPRR